MSIFEVFEPMAAVSAPEADLPRWSARRCGFQKPAGGKAAQRTPGWPGRSANAGWKRRTTLDSGRRDPLPSGTGRRWRRISRSIGRYDAKNQTARLTARAIIGGRPPAWMATPMKTGGAVVAAAVAAVALLSWSEPRPKTPAEERFRVLTLQQGEHGLGHLVGLRHGGQGRLLEHLGLG